MAIVIENLRVSFSTASGLFEAVRGVSLSVGKEKLGIVGESGSGKSLTARSILKLLPRQAILSADHMSFDGVDVLNASERTMRTIRGSKAGLVMQDPKYSLNPLMTAGSQIAEAWRAHRGGSVKSALENATYLLEQVKIRDPKRVMGAYPHELSGGMGQRVMIAMALAPDPDMLIADEPTSALDATVQAELLKLLEDLVSQRGMSLVLISHDLPLISHFCDRVLVMYGGRVMEELAACDLIRAKHPYTKGLLNCLPSLKHPQVRLPLIKRSQAWLD